MASAAAMVETTILPGRVTAQTDPVCISPALRQLAEEHGTDISGIRVVECDGITLEELAVSPEPASRHHYLQTSVCLDRVLALRDRSRAPGGDRPTIQAYLLRAVAVALARIPAVNVRLHGTDVHRYAHADIAVPVDTDRGLLTPIIRFADTKSVSTIGAELRSLTERAHAGELQPNECSGGTFTVSDCGLHGASEFGAIINRQGASLTVSAIRRRPAGGCRSHSFESVARLSLCCDQRAIDSALGAHFLSMLRGVLESADKLDT
jgi:pyruvate dehydrogenase E2 component (dihydrolipoamide acetyltransferase)